MKKIAYAFGLLWLPVRIAAEFGAGGRVRMIMTSYAVFWSIARGKRMERTITLHFCGKHIPIVIASSTDFALIREIFIDKEYAHPHIENVKVIFDVGANVGVASFYFHALYPNATIHAFEADPALFAVLQDRTKAISQIVPHHLALSDTDGTCTFLRQPVLLRGRSPEEQLEIDLLKCRREPLHRLRMN